MLTRRTFMQALASALAVVGVGRVKGETPKPTTIPASAMGPADTHVTISGWSITTTSYPLKGPPIVTVKGSRDNGKTWQDISPRSDGR